MKKTANQPILNRVITELRSEAKRLQTAADILDQQRKQPGSGGRRPGRPRKGGK